MKSGLPAQIKPVGLATRLNKSAKDVTLIFG